MTLLYANGGSVALGSHTFGAARSTTPVQLPQKPTLELIQRFERLLLDQPQVEIEPTHYFAKGLYARQITIPAGTVVTGKLHRTEHLNLLVQGEITVWTEDGMQRLTAPQVIVSKPGTKRVGYAHTDTVWITVHAIEETDIAAIESQLIEPEAPALESGDVKCLSLQQA